MEALDVKQIKNSLTLFEGSNLQPTEIWLIEFSVKQNISNF